MKQTWEERLEDEKDLAELTAQRIAQGEYQCERWFEELAMAQYTFLRKLLIRAQEIASPQARGNYIRRHIAERP